MATAIFFPSWSGLAMEECGGMMWCVPFPCSLRLGVWVCRDTNQCGGFGTCDLEE